ncbi:MAG: hypothetical protein HRJ53_28335, partial [Acidobacteria bacterium Pan2503]|nr:hypothetical protein [Candidatus Acidoferrum panamensis]
AEIESGLRDREGFHIVKGASPLRVAKLALQLAAAYNNKIHTLWQVQFRWSVGGNCIAQEETAAGYTRRLRE